jgi:glyoxylase-like metal-dependent hydrolase (beta-lactamase superfamily II)
MRKGVLSLQKYINCIAHNSSEGQLLAGEKYTALIDCGMVFCADKTIENVKNALGGRALDYILMTHTHYDHIGALPFFREAWPRLSAVTSETGAAVLLKDTPRRVIRELSAIAMRKQNIMSELIYDDDAFRAEITVKDGDTIQLGGLTAVAVETPGHTRDSLCYHIPELDLLILNETPGVSMPDGTIYPCFLTSYTDTIRSIEKCRDIGCKNISLPHRGIASEEDAEGFFDKAAACNAACRDFILGMKELSEEEQLELFYKEYSSDVLSAFQPKEAFYANARATIACVHRESD